MTRSALVVTIPIQIDRKVTPNGRAHWGSKGRITEAMKAAAKLATISTINGLPGQCWEATPPLTLNYLVARAKGRQPMDDDNIKASLKYVQDGIADALGVNDKHMVIGKVQQARDPKGAGYIEVAIEPAQETAA